MNFRKIVKRMKHQWQIKLYLFLLACLLWIFVVINKSYETVVPVKLDTINLREGKLVVSDLPDYVTMRFTGSGKDLIMMKYFNEPRLELNLHTIQHFFDYPIRVNQVILSPELDAIPMTVVSPETVKVVLEDLLERRVRVEPIVDLATQPGYTLLSEPYVLPDSVTISGPRSVVRRMQSVQTERAEFSKARKTIQEELELAIPDSLHVTAKPDKVLLTVEVDKIAQRAIRGVPVGVIRLPRGRNITLEPAMLDVTVTGPAKRLARLTADSIQAYFDFSQWDPETRAYPVEFNLPDGISDAQPDPEEIEVFMGVDSP